MQISENNQKFIAGACSALVATSLTHPLDTIRINQINFRTNFARTISHLYMNKSYRDVIKTFYRGYILNTLAYSGTYGLFFTLNK